MKTQDELRQTMLTMMIAAFRRLEQRLPPAVMTKTVVGPHMRFREQSPAQAVLQKLARLISGLTALKILHEHGMLQEQAVIQRTIDEIDEDIVFICIAEIQQDYTELHRRYLSDFWLEEFDNADVAQSSFKRGLVPRDKIRSYNIRMDGDEDPSTANANLRALYKSYSGYVHAASPQVMDMCLGDPPLFQLQGIKNVYRLRTSYDDAWNYYYRGYAVTCIATMAFGAEEDRERLMSFMRHVESITGIRQ